MEKEKEKEQRRTPKNTRRKTRGKLEHARLYDLSKKTIDIRSAEPRRTDYIRVRRGRGGDAVVHRG